MAGEMALQPVLEALAPGSDRASSSSGCLDSDRPRSKLKIGLAQLLQREPETLVERSPAVPKSHSKLRQHRTIPVSPGVPEVGGNEGPSVGSEDAGEAFLLAMGFSPEEARRASETKADIIEQEREILAASFRKWKDKMGGEAAAPDPIKG